MRIQRSLAPAAAPIAFHDLLHGLAGLFGRERTIRRVELEIQEFFGVKHVFLVCSGKAALLLILVALKSLSNRKQVLIPAYTCFSVPSAIVKAGLTVSCCDIDPQSLDLDYRHLEDALNDDTLCIVPTHLLGLPSNVDRVKTLCEGKGIFVVEDAAQAMGMRHNNRLAGTFGGVSFFSIGRGKNITCGSGGIILTNSDSIAQAIRAEYQNLIPESPSGILRNFWEVLAMRLLIDPRLYWLPAGLPFLGLGETKFYRDFPVHRMDGIRAGLLSSWKQRLSESSSSHSKAAADFHDHLPRSCQVVAPVSEANGIYNRLPLMMNSKSAKDELCTASKTSGLGISPFYPSSIPDIPELKGRFVSGQFPAAARVVHYLVTLPVHQFVRSKDVKRICRLIGQLDVSGDRTGMSSNNQNLVNESAEVQA